VEDALGLDLRGEHLVAIDLGGAHVTVAREHGAQRVEDLGRARGIGSRWRAGRAEPDVTARMGRTAHGVIGTGGHGAACGVGRVGTVVLVPLLRPQRRDHDDHRRGSCQVIAEHPSRA
jgi:hypothetical protein